MPTDQRVTIIRNNVFSKGANSSTGTRARPNVLVGHFPTSGAGSDDHYEIYGNFFWQNPVEALFQGEGNVALYANVMVNSTGAGINIQPHHDVPKTVRIFGNTVIARSSGIHVRGGDPQRVQRAQGNAVFSDLPLSVNDQHGNVVASYEAAASFLNDPFGPLGQFDPFPRDDALIGTAINPSGLSLYGNWDRDFNGLARDWSRRGAYSGQGTNPGWNPSLSTR